jgi:protein disulfide-isomerase
MKKIAIGLIACWALLQAGAEELQWLTDLPKAQAQAKKENKMVMLDFTGSDWCHWCIKLKNDVFSKPDFAKYAKDNLVLVEVDFPHGKKLPADQKKANDALQQKYNVNGFPTIVVLDADGKTAGTIEGYLAEKPFMQKLGELKKKT